MLHENPLMTDIDVDHWRNMQDLILESGKEKRRIIIIHENGEILKFVHSSRAEIVRNIEKIDNPLECAEKVYRANVEDTDFVEVLERGAVEKFFAQVQDTWKASEDLDVYVHRTFATLDEYPDGIVTYPGKARTNLGLQLKVGARFEDIEQAVRKYIPAQSSVVFGVFDGDKLWASLVLSFDTEKKINNVTTADPSELSSSGDKKARAKELVSWINKKYSPCSLGLFMDRDSAKNFLNSKDKQAALAEIAEKGLLIADPLPKSLSLM